MHYYIIEIIHTIFSTVHMLYDEACIICNYATLDWSCQITILKFPNEMLFLIMYIVRARMYLFVVTDFQGLFV